MILTLSNLQLFGTDQFLFGDLSQLLNKHLGAMEPIVIEYTPNMDLEYSNNRIAYEMDFELDDPSRSKLSGVMAGHHTIKDVATLDDKVILNDTRLSLEGPLEHED